MLQKILYKCSSAFYNLHVWFLKKAKGINAPEPYTVKQNEPETNFSILHFIGNFIIGGSSQLVVDIIEGTSHQYKHRIVVPQLPIPLCYQPLEISAFSLSEIDNLYAELAKEKPSIVHIHYFVREYNKFQEFDLWYQSVFKVCEELGIKVIQNVNVPTYPFQSSSVVHNVFVSQFVLDHYNNQPQCPSSVIYPGSDFSHFRNTEPQKLPNKVIGMVYRLDKDKLSKDSIEVFINAVKSDKEISCLIIGGGYFLEYYKQRTVEEKVQSQFTFTGYVPYKSLPDYYKRMSIFVAPVYDESFGQVTPFAMSMGLAVVGYNVGALEEILGNNSTLGEAGNINQLSQIIVDTASDPQKRIALGKANQERSRLFSVELMIDKYLELYNLYIND